MLTTGNKKPNNKINKNIKNFLLKIKTKIKQIKINATTLIIKITFEFCETNT